MDVPIPKQKNKRRRPKGLGSLVKRDESPYWYLCFTVRGKKKILSLKTKDKKEAERQADSLLRPLIEAKTKESLAYHIGEARNILKRNNIKVDDVWNLYLKNPMRPNSGNTTLEFYRRYWEIFKNWMNQKYPSVIYFSDISEEIANEYASTREVAGRGYNERIKTLRLITRVFQKAGAPYENYWNQISLKSEQPISRSELTEEELFKILDSFEDENLQVRNKSEMKVLFHIGAWTGLRLADVAQIRWDNLDFERRLITIQPQKTKRLEKTIHIPMHTRLIQELNKLEKIAGNDYVLPAVSLRYIENPCGINADIKKVFEHNGFKTSIAPKGQRQNRICKYGFHSFRHSFVSFCAKAGVPLAIVQSIVGHGSPAITRHYIHIGQESIEKAIQALPQ